MTLQQQQQVMPTTRRTTSNHENLKRKSLDSDDEQQPPAKRRKILQQESLQNTLTYMVQEDVATHYPLLDHAVAQQDDDEAMIATNTITEAMEMVPYSDQQSTSKFAAFPASVLSYIFLFLNQMAVLQQIAPVCKHWYMVAKFAAVPVWRHLDYNALALAAASQAHIDDNKTVPIQDVKMSMAQITDFLQLLTRNSMNDTQVPAQFRGQVTFPKICTHVNAKGFQKMKQLYPTMKKLILPQLDINNANSVANSVTDACLKQVAKFGHLEQLRLSTHVKVSDLGIASLVQRAPLMVLDLDQCHGISSASFQTVLNQCRLLQSLSMLGNGSTILEKSNIDALAHDSYELQELRADIGTSISVDALKQFVCKCKKLKTLYLRGCPNFNSDCMQALVSGLKYLESLTIVFADGVKLVQPKFASLSLKSLHLSRPEQLTHAHLSCPQLTTCYIDQCRDLQNLQFGNCFAMSELRLRSSNTSKMNMEQLFGLKDQLKELELFDCRLASSGKIFIQSASLQKFVLFMCNDVTELNLQCDKLHTLSVDVCTELDKMKLNCPILETVQLFVLPQIQPPKISHFSLSSNKLACLNLQRTTFLSTLSLHCEQLDSLNMAGCRDLKFIDHLYCPKLDKLAIGSSVLEYQNDKIIQSLINGCPSISMLSISNAPQLSDSRLAALCEHLGNLQALVISNCNQLRHPKLVAPTLKGIQMTDCSQINAISIQSSNLSKLFLRNCTSVTDATMQQISTTCPNVKFLEIFNCPALKNPILACNELTDLHFSRCDHLEAPVLNCPSLKKLLFISNAKIRDLKFQTDCDAASELLFSDCPQVSDALIHRLQHCTKNIQAMVFAKCENIRKPNINFQQLKIARFSECPQLVRPQFQTTMHLNVLAFQDCPSLDFNSVRNLCIAPTDSITIDQIEIQQCDHLQMLQVDVPCQRVHIGKCENLQDVILYSVAERIKIEECPVLLTVWSPSGCSLALQECSIRACCELNEIKLDSCLKRLELVKCPRISDLMVMQLLNKCRAHLETIEIVDCNVNPIVIQNYVM